MAGLVACVPPPLTLVSSVLPGAFCDLVWSDPEDVDTWSTSPRGAGWLFGAKVTHEFMAENSLKLICRAHQLVNEGERRRVIRRRPFVVAVSDRDGRLECSVAQYSTACWNC